jgi:acetolactate synthase-1/2/3 large subunit
LESVVRQVVPEVLDAGFYRELRQELAEWVSILLRVVAADLAPQTRYDDVVEALGGAGETVTDSNQIGAALDRAFASGVPYMVNVITDVNAAYPRNTLGI